MSVPLNRPANGEIKVVAAKLMLSKVAGGVSARILLLGQAPYDTV